MEKYILVAVTILTGIQIGLFAYSMTPRTAPAEDLNRDGVVDLTDFSIAAYTLGNIMHTLRMECYECNQTSPANVPQ